MAPAMIRPYAPSDRDAVRHICFVTGDAGDPVASQWADAESFADMYTGYYTDEEPESAFVAESDGKVVGYLLGCRDSTRAWSPASVAARHALRSGLLVRPGTAGYLWRAVGDIVADRVRSGVRPNDLAFTDPAYPAHLHIDLLERARGTGVGAALMRTWLDTLRAEGVPGCHLQTMAQNRAAIGFFAAMGFRRHGEPVPSPGHRRAGARTHVQAMVQSLR